MAIILKFDKAGNIICPWCNTTDTLYLYHGSHHCRKCSLYMDNDPYYEMDGKSYSEEQFFRLLKLKAFL